MKALIIIDIQNDFLPGGALAVPEGDKVIPVINGIQHRYDLVIASQDWHPEGHSSFASSHPDKNAFETVMWDGYEQTLWPDHCIQGTHGALLATSLEKHRIEAIIRKGTDPQIDSYSAFYDNLRKKSTGLSGYLKERGVMEVHFCGLAADYCVWYSMQDAVTEGFTVGLIENATRPIDALAFEDIKREIKSRGIQLLEF